jgi:hypothetical protein
MEPSRKSKSAICKKSIDRSTGKTKYISWNARPSKWVVRVRLGGVDGLRYVGSYHTNDEADMAAEEAIITHNLTRYSYVEDDVDEDKENVPPEIDDMYTWVNDLLGDDFTRGQCADTDECLTDIHTSGPVDEPPSTFAIGIAFRAFGLEPPSFNTWETVIDQVWNDNNGCIWPLYRQMFPGTDFGSTEFVRSEFGSMDTGLMSNDVIKRIIRSSGKLDMIRSRSHQQFMSSSSPLLVYGLVAGDQCLHVSIVVDGRLHSSRFNSIVEGTRVFYSKPKAFLLEFYEMLTSIYILTETKFLVYAH